MNSYLLAGLLATLSTPFLASAACPAGTNPSTFLLGKTWAFRVTGEIPERGVIGAIGTFAATGPGYLSIVETVVDAVPILQGAVNAAVNTAAGNIVNRLAPTSGRWLVNADCTGGELQFMLNREFFTLQFVLSPDGTEMTLTGADQLTITNNNGRRVRSVDYPLQGTARLDPPRACPPGLGNPLNLLKGTKFSYVASGGFYTESGTFTPSFLNPFAYSGDLTLDRTILSTLFPVTDDFVPNFPTYGRYIIYNDCSGGELLFNVNRRSIQLEFVFSKADFSEMFFLGDNLLEPITRQRILANPTSPIIPFVFLPYTGIATKI